MMYTFKVVHDQFAKANCVLERKLSEKANIFNRSVFLFALNVH